ncbi:MAG: rubredoxin [Pseudarcicella sp.]|nr:rubredoxin [Pseudarcicella sp.]
MKDYSLIKINLRGGIVSPGILQDILVLAKNGGSREVRFGARQQLYLWMRSETVRGNAMIEFKQKLDENNIEYETETDVFPNIISSYCAEEVFPTGQWLSEGIYQDIFDGFDFSPKLKVNISDHEQSFTPFFTGNLNFIASDTANFWYLYVRPKQSNQVFLFPILIYTLEIPKLCQRLEEVLLGENVTDEHLIYEKVIAKGQIISQVIQSELQLPKFSLPYYEGFNRYGNKTWLGIYRRNEVFDIDFLIEACKICLDTKIGQICTTPWKSLIIKGIENKDRTLWDKLLGKYAINVRHAANELNWQVEDLSEEGLNIKKSVIREFDDEDVRTFGLSFAIQTKAKSELFGAVLVKKRLIFAGLSFVYDIYHSQDFNPNARELVLFEKGVNKAHLAEMLQRLTKRFYAQASKSDLVEKTKKEKSKKESNKIKAHQYQCQTCFTIYDETFGDIHNQIPAGIRFEDLPNDYCCSVCDASKEQYQKVELALV